MSSAAIHCNFNVHGPLSRLWYGLYLMVFIGIYHLLFYLIQSIQFSQMKEVRVCLLNYIICMVLQWCAVPIAIGTCWMGRPLFKGLDPINQLLWSKTFHSQYCILKLLTRDLYDPCQGYLSRFISQHLGFNISSPEGALVRVLITTLPKNLQDADPTKHGKWAVLNFFILYTPNIYAISPGLHM